MALEGSQGSADGSNLGLETMKCAALVWLHHAALQEKKAPPIKEILFAFKLKCPGNVANVVILHLMGPVQDDEAISNAVKTNRQNS